MAAHSVGPLFFFSSRRRHTRLVSDWSSDVCSSDLGLSRGFESFRQPFPFRHQTLQIGLPASQFLRLALRFVRAHKALEFSFAQGNRGFGVGNLFFYLVQTIFHLLALTNLVGS